MSHLQACAPERPPAEGGLLLFHNPPAGYLAFPINDDTARPVLRQGDIAIIDTDQREPVGHELYLIQWTSGRKQIVEVFSRIYRGEGGAPRCGWYTGRPARPRTAVARQALVNLGLFQTLMIDGPRSHFGEALIGRVVGVVTAELDFASMVEVSNA
jgi:hypothetical protein